MGAQWFCDQCGGPISNTEAVPMAIGYPKPPPVEMLGPMGQSVRAVPLGNGMFGPYKEDPKHIFENFQLCYSCAYGLAIIFKNKAKLIKYVPVVNNKPTDA